MYQLRQKVKWADAARRTKKRSGKHEAGSMKHEAGSWEREFMLLASPGNGFPIADDRIPKHYIDLSIIRISRRK
jgi:hypothetical protein